MNADDPLNWAQEKEEFQNLLAEMNVNPQDIGYNPNYKTVITVEQSEKGVHFRGGWLDEILPKDDVNLGPDQEKQ